MNGKDKISVIIPCYNVQKYIMRCFDSIYSHPQNSIPIKLQISYHANQFSLLMVQEQLATFSGSPGKQADTILTRAGITLIITVAFSISTMLYNLSGEYPFFLTAFLQIVTFAGIYFKLGDLMGDVLLTERGFPKHGKPHHAKTPYAHARPYAPFTA